MEVKMENESVWLSQRDIGNLFETERSVITKHLRNIFISEELNENSVCAIFAHTAADGKKYRTKFYNLDAIISIGYRVNSKKATQFRIWATNVLKKYLVKGYAVNEKRLEEARDNLVDLQSAVQFLNNKISSDNLKGLEKELLGLLADYSKTLTVLEEFDKSSFKKLKGVKPNYELKYDEAVKVLVGVKRELFKKGEAGDLFARERGKEFEGIIGAIYQTFAGNELYGSIEKKAAHLLYLIIKDHPFADGNKRSAAFLFVYFLDRNKYLYKKSGEKKVNDNALAALALLVAESDPKEKDIMIKLIINLITEK